MTVNLSNELKIYHDDTVNLNIFSQPIESRFLSLRLYMIDALTLISSKFPPEGETWLQYVKDCTDEIISMEKTIERRNEIIDYRKNKLQLTKILPNPESENDALTMLFLEAIVHKQEDTTTHNKGNVIQDIDEFSNLYIEFFGHATELFSFLVKNFGVALPTR